MSAATAPLAPPHNQISIDVGAGLVLLVRSRDAGVVSAALYLKSELRGSLSYATGRATRARVVDDGEGQATLWIAHAAFDLPPAHMSAVRAFLDAARRTGGAA